MKVTTVGLGYIGLPTSALIASKEIEVNGVDVDQNVVNTINKGEIHIVEPDLDKVVKDVVDRGFLKASSSVMMGDVYLIVVPTPFKGNHEPDISFIEAATESVIPLLKNGDLYIIESTSPIGTTEKMRDLILESRPELKNLYFAYCPERVLPGNVLHELVYNDRVIGGVDEESTHFASEFYKKFVEGELHQTDAKTAEMCKLVENASRDVQIAFANELSFICDKANVDVWKLIELANKHPRVNILQPGCGVGGHCIAVDPYFIVSDYPEESKIIRAARDINNNKVDWCVKKIRETKDSFKKMNGYDPKIAIFGLSFKPNIDDLRESPAVSIAEKVLHSNNEGIFIVEPNIESHKSFDLTDHLTAFERAEIICFLVAHDQFKYFENTTGKIILDFCGALNN